MANASLEHVNMTVSDPKKTAQMLVDLFDWEIRWEGPSMSNGYSVHVGAKDNYVAIYTNQSAGAALKPTAQFKGALNHLGIVVDDLEVLEQRVKKMGFAPFNHGTYEPGRRFYFYDHDEIEYEIVSYN